jgi:hypothetical protein
MSESAWVIASAVIVTAVAIALEYAVYRALLYAENRRHEQAMEAIGGKDWRVLYARMKQLESIKPGEQTRAVSKHF